MRSEFELAWRVQLPGGPHNTCLLTATTSTHSAGVPSPLCAQAWAELGLLRPELGLLRAKLAEEQNKVRGSLRLAVSSRPSYNCACALTGLPFLPFAWGLGTCCLRPGRALRL